MGHFITNRNVPKFDEHLGGTILQHLIDLVIHVNLVFSYNKENL